ncbi:MAG TPA: hypothetical protein VII95_08020 [Terriglobales bacterium]
MAEPLIAFGRFLGSVTLAGVMIISPLFLSGQQNTVVAPVGVAGGAVPT